MKRNVLFIVILFTISTSVFAQTKAVSVPFSRGFNTTGWFEGQPFNPNYYTKQDFINFKAMDCDVFRIPVSFEKFIIDDKNTIDPALLKTLDEAVIWAEELQLYVIIDFAEDLLFSSFPDTNFLLDIWDQISKRYSNASEYVLYELMNEPRHIEEAEWGTIQKKILSKVRENDKNHYVLLTSTDGNSIETMLKLPKYKDDKIIYSFHFYDPHLFTHQGVENIGLSNIQNIPFPYDSAKKLNLPENLSDAAKYYINNYPQKGTEKYIINQIEEAAKFSQKRKVPVICGEYGVYDKYADSADRTAYYKFVTDAFEARGIPHINYDYTLPFGVFKPRYNYRQQPDFPDELNIDIVEAMNMKVPETSSTESVGFIDINRKSGTYPIFKNGVCPQVGVNLWINGNKEDNAVEKESGEKIISIKKADAWGSLQFYFMKNQNLKELLDKNFCLELEIRNENKDLDLFVNFIDNDNSVEDFPWETMYYISADRISADGKWHKIRIPLSYFNPEDFWDNNQQKVIPHEDHFSWEKVKSVSISNRDKDIQKPLEFRNIQLCK